MASNNFSVRQFRRDRTLNIIQGEPKFLNQIVSGMNLNEIYCFLSSNETLLVSDELLYNTVDKYYSSGINILYTDNIVTLETIKIRQYLPTISYDKNIVINTPLIVYGKSPIQFNEQLKRLVFWDFLVRSKKQAIIHHTPEPLFGVASLSKEEQEKDLKLCQKP